MQEVKHNAAVITDHDIFTQRQGTIKAFGLLSRIITHKGRFQRYSGLCFNTFSDIIGGPFCTRGVFYYYMRNKFYTPIRGMELRFLCQQDRIH
jgi:hypothetical protein